jgi:putative transcriptional regulator
MLRRSLICPGLAGTAFLLAAVATGAADAPPTDADPSLQAGQLLAGQLLIASAGIQDPRFSHTVILLLRHDAKGAFGIVINRPLGEQPIADILAATVQDRTSGTSKDDKSIEGTIRVFAGGPVQRERGFVVHSPDYRRDGTLTIDHIVAMTADPQVLRDIGHHRGPRQSFFALGYAGWGAGQLDAEMTRRDWFTTSADAQLIFDDDRDQLWERALARRTRDL